VIEAPADPQRESRPGRRKVRLYPEFLRGRPHRYKEYICIAAAHLFGHARRIRAREVPVAVSGDYQAGMLGRKTRDHLADRLFARTQKKNAQALPGRVGNKPLEYIYPGDALF
jgi:hypothetical protein